MAAAADDAAVPSLSYVVNLAEQALWLATSLSAPMLAAAAGVGLIVALFQAATQINDATIAHVPRFLAVVVVLALSGNYLGGQLTRFAERAFAGAVQ